jgi:uncharacterized protein YunC (DUF1805 family)
MNKENSTNAGTGKAISLREIAIQHISLLDNSGYPAGNYINMDTAEALEAAQKKVSQTLARIGEAEIEDQVWRLANESENYGMEEGMKIGARLIFELLIADSLMGKWRT